jgi:hypothetical protein
MLARCKAVVVFVMVSLAGSPVLAQHARGDTAPGLSNGVTRGGLSIALAKLERKGEEVRVWVAFRKVGPVSGSAHFLLNIRDDRGNLYPIDPGVGTVVVDLSVPGVPFIGPTIDLALLPVGFTWVRSGTVEMPAKAPIHSILLYADPLNDHISLDPRSARWPTIDLDVVRKNDVTGKKFKLSRDITVWFGQPMWEQSQKVVEEKTQRIRWRILR